MKDLELLLMTRQEPIMGLLLMDPHGRPQLIVFQEDVFSLMEVMIISTYQMLIASLQQVPDGVYLAG
jgi:hypothetical protein